MSNIFIFIHCYGFYFDLIGYIKFIFLIIFYSNILRLQIKILYYVCSIIHLLEFESALFYFFILWRQVFSLSKDNGLYSPLPPLKIVFSIELIDFLIAHECDHLFGSLLPLEIQSQAFVFSPCGGWQDNIGPRRRIPKWEYKTDRHSSLITCTQGEVHEMECSTNAPIYIRPPQKPPQIRGF